MSRRISLALALAFTTIVTFAVIALGAQAGIFSASKPSTAAATVQDAATTTPAPPAVAQDAPAAADPVVITNYVYVEDTPVAGRPAPAQADPTSAAQPASTPRAGGTPTASPAPAQTAAPSPTTAAAPTATAAQQPAPTSAALPAEIEFVGTVTAINGNQVTFLHGGAATTIKVTNPGALSVGASAHVHALLTSTGYVATEVQVGG